VPSFAFFPAIDRRITFHAIPRQIILVILVSYTVLPAEGEIVAPLGPAFEANSHNNSWI
jgi:hypothetical protein